MSFSHVLICRPADAADALAGALRDLPARVVVLPAVRFSALDARQHADAAWHAAASRLIVFTSPRAVAFGLPALDAALFGRAVVAAVGAATAAALRAAGHAVALVPEQADSEGLLESRSLPATPGEAMVVAAPGGRRVLHEGLASRGWRVREALVYQRHALPPDPRLVAELASAAGVASVFTSGFALRSLLDVMEPGARARVLAGTMLVASPRLVALARELGARDARDCGGADNATLEQAVRGLWAGG